MPFYDYKFIDTGEIIEVKHPINQDALTEIDGREVKRVIRANPVHFHGTDFYDTTYKKKQYLEKK